MATYLIDYENVSKDGLNGVTRLTEADRVIIFYSERADRMTFGLHRRLNETKATIEYRKVEVGGHNALDFQLATYLGYLIAQNSSEEYCIVSHDRGFEFLAGFWKKPQFNVCLTRAISESPQAEERNAKKRGRKRTAGQETVKAADDGAVEAAAVTVEVESAESAAENGETLAEAAALASAEAAADCAEVESAESAVLSEAEVEVQAEAEGAEVESAEPEGVPAAEPAEEVRAEATEETEGSQLQTEEAVAEAVAEEAQGEPVAEDVPAEEEAAAEVQEDESPAVEQAAEETPAPKRTRKRRSSGRSRRKKAAVPFLSEVRGLLGSNGLQDKEMEEIAGFVDHYKTKQGVNNALVRKFGNQKGGELYQGIKSLLKDKKGREEPKTE